MTTKLERCACCGERIERPRAGKVYCSGRCRTRAWRARWLAAIMDHVCDPDRYPMRPDWSRIGPRKPRLRIVRDR